MPDPRKNTFSVTGCLRKNKLAQNDNEKRKSFLDGITNVGNLEILNDIGYGRVGEGLRTLASVSDSIRVGESIVPGREGTELYNTTLGRIANTASDSINEGADAVLEAVGLNPVAVSGSLNSLNPGVANRAYAQAQDIYQRVKSGNFKTSDIPEVFSDLQNLEILARGIFTTQDRDTRKYERCVASPYAVDLIRYAPKFKFLFVVDFTLTAPYQPWGKYTQEMAFVVKRSTRPSVEFEYEDINMYNFRTKVAKRSVYPPLSMTFYDDNRNNAFLFYTAYMRAMSPIANMQQGVGDQVGDYEARSMNFSSSMNGTFGQNDPVTRRYSASLGPLNDNVHNILGRLRLFQIFDYGRLMNIYNFYNPRILTFGLDELNMAESGDGNEFEFQFDYDGMYVQPGWDVKNVQDNIDIKALTGGDVLFYPIDPIFNENDTSTDRSQQAPTAQEQEQNRTVIDEVTGAFDSITGLARSGTELLNSATRQGSRFLNEIGTTATIATDLAQQTAGQITGSLSGAASAPGRIAQSEIRSRVAFPSTFDGSTFSARTNTSRFV